MAEQVQSAFAMQAYVEDIARRARRAARNAARASTDQRNQALCIAANAIEASTTAIQTANKLDLAAGRQSGLSAAMLDRLELTDARIELMARGLREVAELSDPVGKISELIQRPSGIRVGRMRVPLGVIGIIYESRPSVTAEAGGLCVKSGNAVILRGGSEAFHSNLAIVKCLQRGLEATGLASDIIQFIESTDRDAIDVLISMEDCVDVVVPRGGKGLIERLSSKSRVPLIKHLDGVCHVYVDDDACLDKAMAIVLNSKTHRYGVCNAMETLLLGETIARKILPAIVEALQEKGVELRGCAVSRCISPDILPATQADWYAEYLAPILAIRVVANIDQAIDHIAQYGSEHTDCIVTQNTDRAEKFMREVNSSSVMLNASTRFADGFEYGLGAEIGISTNKLHARGPVGLEGLTIEKFVVYGDGTIRE